MNLNIPSNISTSFYKAHGLENDFVIIDHDFLQQVSPTIPFSDYITKISNRHTGVGCDQLILIDANNTSIHVWFYNSDGTPAETCGNGLRCVAKLLHYKTSCTKITIVTMVGNKIKGNYDAIIDEDGSVTVNMGCPAFSHDTFGQEGLYFPEIDMMGYPVAIGNPHVVFFANDLEKINLSAIGSLIENYKHFPNKTNVTFASLNQIHKRIIFMRVWERGAGITKACGSAACAAVAVAFRNNFISNPDLPITVSQPGGDLKILADQATGCIYQTGDAAISFAGDLYL